MSTFVLIPGAWHGAWSWRPVAERLRAAGHRALTLTLPGMNGGDDPSGYRLQDAIEYIAQEVRRLTPGNVVLVAHSWGGCPATGAARELCGRVDKLVFYNGHVPLRGRSLLDENPPDKRLSAAGVDQGIADGRRSGDHGIPPAGVDAGRLARSTAVGGRSVDAPAGGYFLGALDIDAVDLGIPRVYLTGDEDVAMPRPAAESAARIGVRPVVVPGTHHGLLTHPDELAKAILAA